MAEKIYANPPVDYAIEGGEVTYTCTDRQRDWKQDDSHEGEERAKFIWSVTYGKNPRAPKKPEFFFDKWNPDRWEATLKWRHSGTHNVTCVVKATTGGRIHERTQKVITQTQALSQALADARKTHEPPHPWTTYQHAVAYIEKLEKMHALEKKHYAERNHSSPSVDKLKRYADGIFEAKIEKYKKYRDALRKLHLKYTNNAGVFCPFFVAHVNLETHDTRMLNVCVINYMASGSSPPINQGRPWCSLEILDWTNPEDARSWTGFGSTFKEALEHALENWEEFCNYYPGRVKYTIPRWIPGGFISKDFKTGEKSRFATVAEWLGWSSTSLALIAMFGVLMPGSAVVTLSLWAALTAGTGSGSPRTDRPRAG